MNQKEEMHNEGGGGAGGARPQKSDQQNSYGWVKWVAFGLIISALAVGLVLTFIK